MGAILSQSLDFAKSAGNLLVDSFVKIDSFEGIAKIASVGMAVASWAILRNGAEHAKRFSEVKATCEHYMEIYNGKKSIPILNNVSCK